MLELLEAALGPALGQQSATGRQIRAQLCDRGALATVVGHGVVGGERIAPVEGDGPDLHAAILRPHGPRQGGRRRCHVFPVTAFQGGKQGVPALSGHRIG